MKQCAQSSPCMPSSAPAGADAPLLPEVRDTRDRLIEAISAHGPITATRLADMFGLTSAAVRRHLSALEADGAIEEHSVPVAQRRRGRPSKAFVLSASAHRDLDSEYSELAALALDELARRGGGEALSDLGCARVAPWEEALAERVLVEESAGRAVTRARRVELLADLLTERGYAATVRPVTVEVPLTTGSGRARTVETAQLVQGHCPIQDVAARHPELCEIETQALARMAGAPVQRLATLAGGAHACTTHIPLTEGNTPR
ncbi:winged helix-turn-helix transcriptional regulator [Brachybacterium sp. JHP9]|uniref:Winged helix-turn-helix transcriptional regulator n=1 Tax=Brachybacterium equifaecis TaxID=2910770 RepID=A0ABT0R0I8_9MICO|nr:crosslink repair DNA glycosylase YcaQ family protein [Brachybacterium equifaecis]MCL6423434.1 winged helix-turn-helix transcriptional regulator [Brachybacterium equifaecis]